MKSKNRILAKMGSPNGIFMPINGGMWVTQISSSINSLHGKVGE